MKSKPKRLWWVGPEKAPGWFEIVFSLAFFGVFPTIGIYLLVAADRQGIDAEVTEGTVIAFETHRDINDDRVTYATVVEYQVEAKHYRCRGIASNPALHYTGQKVEVLYKRESPDAGFIDSFVDRWLGGLIFTLIGLPLFAWAVFSLFFSRMFYNWLRRRPH